MKTLICTIVLSLLSFNILAHNLIPAPISYKKLSSKTTEIKTRKIDTSYKYNIPEEGYSLRINKGKLTIKASTNRGYLWGLQTLKQLELPDGLYPQVQIEDAPAFDIRGFMYDAGRNFMEVGMIKQYLDLCSAYKLNTFHWHLTDNPAWRIESKVYPELNDAKFQRQGRDAGRFYTYDEIRDVIAYARERGIQVIPEIDMPGHSKFFNLTFSTSMDSPKGMSILEKCLDEFFNEIPKDLAPYIHIGSDEVHIKDQKGFIFWIENFVAQYDRVPLSWSPGLPASINTIKQIWQGEGDQSTATQSLDNKGKYLDSYMSYLNLHDPILFTSMNFLHKACNKEQGDEHALGGILCLWNDVKVSDKTKLITHNGVISGIVAFSERFWVGGNPEHKQTTTILPEPTSVAGQKLLEFENRLSYHRDNHIQSSDFRWVKNSHIPWRITIQDSSFNSIVAWGGGIDLSSQVKEADMVIGNTAMAIAKTNIYVNQDTTIRAWVGFETTRRSTKLGNGIGKQGQWECDGKLFVNGQTIAPAKEWEEPEKYNFKYHTWHKPEEELPYTDEQFYWTREPVYIKLNKGLNQIEMHVPKTFQEQYWNFAFIPLAIDSDGKVSDATGIDYKL